MESKFAINGVELYLRGMEKKESESGTVAITALPALDEERWLLKK